MTRRFTRLRFLRCAVIALTIGVLVAVFGAPSAAYADGNFRWQNSWNGSYLEVLYSSTDATARVITYPLNTSSANQVWHDHQLSDGYFYLMNLNSAMVLDRWDYGYTYIWPDATGPTCSQGMQYYWTDQTWQHWGYRSVWDTWDDRYYTFWINKYGCAGNPYHDVLSVPLAGSAPSMTWTTLYPEDYCSDQRYGPSAMCYWKRNGQ
ncbi:MAG: RICIN domain-containing protein [Thermobispora bispora]|nr:RICIN domain-containing protein [Thermobispora bispora]